jgi:hypothetical protein
MLLCGIHPLIMLFLQVGQVTVLAFLIRFLLMVISHELTRVYRPMPDNKHMRIAFQYHRIPHWYAADMRGLVARCFEVG